MRCLWERHWRWLWSAPGQGLASWSSSLGLGIGLVSLFLARQQWRQGEIGLLSTWMAGWLVTSSGADVLPAGWWRAPGILRLTSEIVIVVGLVYVCRQRSRSALPLMAVPGQA